MRIEPDKLAELKETFDYNDADQDGDIDLEEFVSMLDDLEAGMERAVATVGFESIDADNDGKIDFLEFVRWWSVR